MVNEAISTLEYYFRNESNIVQFWGSGDGVNMFDDFLHNGKTIAGDAPDMVLLKDNTVIIIEHFEYDCSYSNKKGSSSRIELDRIEKEQRKQFSNVAPGVYHSVIHASFSYKNLIRNVQKSFMHHYERIEIYKQNLIERKIINHNTIVKIMFLISDVSPIGSIAIDKSNGKPQEIPVILAQSPEFLDMIDKCNKVDFVLCCSCPANDEYVWFIDRNEVSLYKEKQCNYESMRFISNFPHVVIKRFDI